MMSATKAAFPCHDEEVAKSRPENICAEWQWEGWVGMGMTQGEFGNRMHFDDEDHEVGSIIFWFREEGPNDFKGGPTFVVTH
jgi:hypothetical protein